MRLIVAVIFLLFVSGALIYYQCTHKDQRETQVEQQQTSASAISPAVHQPQTINETANAYDARRDCLYRLYLFATIAGVLVALSGIYVFYLQTKATQDSVRAALLNAQAVINSQRPRIAVRRREPSIPDSFVFEAICLSGIPANIIHNYVDSQGVPSGETLRPIYKTDMLGFPYILAPSLGAKYIGDFAAGTFKANEPLWKEIQSLTKTLYFFGKIEYTDGISFDDAGKRIIHETKWCYEYNIGGAIFRSGPPEANDYT